MPNASGVTFVTEPLVRVRINGGGTEGFPPGLYQFMAAGHIVPVAPAECREGSYSGLFTLDQAKRIDHWLLREGARRGV